MSARPGFTVSKVVPCDGGVSPNAYVGQVTVEIRVHYPPKQVLLAGDTMADAVEEAVTEMVRRISVDKLERKE